MTGGEKDKPGVVARPPLLYLAAIVLGWIAHDSFGGPDVPGPVRWAGVGLVVTAFVLMFWAGLQFRRAGTSFHVSDPDTAVLTTGPFRYTRNPLYVGLTAITSGVALAIGRPWILAFVIVVLVVMRYGVIAREERYLERKFGTEYTDYKERVRRWI